MKNLVLLLITFQVINAGDYPPIETIVSYPCGISMYYKDCNNCDEEEALELAARLDVKSSILKTMDREGKSKEEFEKAVQSEKPEYYIIEDNSAELIMGEGFAITPGFKKMIMYVLAEEKDADAIVSYLRKKFLYRKVRYFEFQKAVHFYLLQQQEELEAPMDVDLIEEIQGKIALVNLDGQ